MSAPITAEFRQAALEVLVGCRLAFDNENGHHALVEAIARAIQEAEARGRRAGLEKAASIAQARGVELDRSKLEAEIIASAILDERRAETGEG